MDARCKKWTATYKFCVNIRWLATNTGFFNQQYSAQGGRSWMGSQVEGRRDGSGLMYMRNRYYDPATARFTQEDPIGLGGGLNLYGFAKGDPVSYSDPYGLSACPIEWGGDGRTETLADCPAGSAGQEEYNRRRSGRADREDGFLFGVVSAGVGIGYSGMKALGGSALRSLTRILADEAGSLPGGLPSYVRKTLKIIDDTGHAPAGHVGGRRFNNDGRGGGEVLRRTDSDGNAIHYREWDVHPRQPGVNRGAERVVTGSDGSAYYTSNHYQTFTPIR